MQILEWLLKVIHEPPRQRDCSSSSNKKEGLKCNQKVEYKDTTLLKIPKIKRRRIKANQAEFVCKNLNLFKITRIKDIANACFYCTLNLKRVGSCRRRQHFVNSMKMKKEDLARGLGMIGSHKAEKKVLPISEQNTPSSSSTNDNDNQCGSTAENKGKTKGDKAKTLSKMKELLRWAAAAAKAEKGGKYISRKVLHFRNKAALKAVPDDDQLSNDSPKISFRWDVESCSTTSSVYSAISSVASSSMNFDHASVARLRPSQISTPLHNSDLSVVRPGNWITTDSEFVVLEL